MQEGKSTAPRRIWDSGFTKNTCKIKPLESRGIKRTRLRENKSDKKTSKNKKQL